MVGHIHHAILTRFNVRRGADIDPRVLSLEWLDERMQLFEKVTVASVMAQSQLPDAWLVFFDENTPQSARDLFQRIAANLPQLRAEYCREFTAQVCAERISRRLPEGVDWLITTRLDNDDALNPRFIEGVRSLVHPGVREFINPTHGLIAAQGMLFRKRDYSSPFISLSEPLNGFSTVLIDQHQRLSRHGHVRQCSLTDAWIQVVHGSNLANQVRGVRVSPSMVSMQVLPPFLRESIWDVSMAQMVLDNSFGLIGRYAGSVRRRIKRIWADRITQA